MIWFQRLFPVVMLAWPLAALALLDRQLGGRTRRGAIRLLAVVAMAIHVGVQLWIETSTAPAAAVRVAWPVGYGVFSSTLLWFAVAVSSLIAVYGHLEPGRSREPVRTASLVPRHLDGPISRTAWWVGWIGFAANTALIAWAIVRGAPVAMVAGLGFWLFCAVLGGRMSLTEPEPLDPAASGELVEAYERLRRFKAWSFYGLGLTGTAVFAVVSVLLVFRPGLGGLMGAILGTTVGLAGAAFGAVAGVWRARIVEMRRRLAR